MHRLVAIDAVPGDGFVRALQDAWEHEDAVLPVDPRLPPAPREALLRALREGEPVEPGDALVVPTSGTTGTPRGVVLTADAVAASAAASSARLAVDPGSDRWLACLPLSHVGGLSVVTRALLTGTPLTFDPGAPATLVSLVPTQLRRLDTSRFRTVLLGGQAAPAELPPNVVTTYGMTETGSGVAYDGVPLPGVEVRTRGGEIEVRGPMLMRCYRDGTDPKDDGGWLPTGDAGEVGPDGRFVVRGRLSELIITGGENVWPTPVEHRLREHAGVSDAAVAGLPDPEWGERVVAFVVPADPSAPPDLATLRAWVKERLPAYAAPKQVVLVDSLPRTRLGKLRREELPGSARA